MSDDRPPPVRPPLSDRHPDGETTSAPVVVVGGGPVGLALGLGLARHGVRSVVLERALRPSDHSKAAVIHVRTREILRQWGVEPAFLAAGTLRSSLTIHRAPDGAPRLTLDLAELASDVEDPGLLLLEQSETERLLLEEVRRSELCEVRFGAELTGLVRCDSSVSITVRSGRGDEQLAASYLVGCDGASSSVRRMVGLPFRGLTYHVRPMLADVRVDDARDQLPWPRQHQGPGGVTNAVRLRPGLWRIIRLDDHDPGDGPGVEHDDSVPEADSRAVGEAEVQRRVAEVLGPGAVEVVWADRFRIHRRSAPRFRLGRIMLAGDAAHIHSPLGGLGMNAGIQDVHNLAWKLAAALRGGDADRLLGSYDTERRAVVVEQVSRTTDLATRVFLQSPPAIRERSVSVARWAMGVGPARRRALRALSMLDLAYPGSALLDPRHRSAGIRLPDPVLVTPDGEEVRLHRLLPAAAAVWIEVASGPGPRGTAIGPVSSWAPSAAPGVPDVLRLRVGPGGHQDPGGRLRRLLDGEQGSILVRPDGHVAWAHAGVRHPDEWWVAWSLGTGTGPPRSPAPEHVPRGLTRFARDLRDRTELDLPHVR